MNIPSGRIAQIVRTYDDQGEHRTATAADDGCGEWLAAELHAIGLECAVEEFPVVRIDPQTCCIRVAGRAIDGVPAFDARFTDSRGIAGRLGLKGSDAPITLMRAAPSHLMSAGSERERALDSDFHRDNGAGVVLVTAGARAGLYLLNAPLFNTPSGPPTLQVSSTENEWLIEQATHHKEAQLIVHVTKTVTSAYNVVATIAGSDPGLSPLVISTPRSGWWRCASERGGGIACWLETARAVAAGEPRRDCIFVALSGHELGGLGMHAYLEAREHLVRDAIWIQLGANIGAPGKPNQICASDEPLAAWARSALEAEGIIANVAAQGSVPFGEARMIKLGGGRFAAIICDSDVFHHPDDRWPDAVDVSLLARYARAFARGVLRLAEGR